MKFRNVTETPRRPTRDAKLVDPGKTANFDGLEAAMAQQSPYFVEVKAEPPDVTAPRPPLDQPGPPVKPVAKPRKKAKK